MATRLKKIAMTGFMVIGVVSFFLIVIGLYLDISRFDETSGGYEPLMRIIQVNQLTLLLLINQMKELLAEVILWIFI
ncbi:hypothetical protein [Bacillus sp. JCM 19034]|uniref:hypothetical protein n=1 Tax=Bacillus sp. JCM 19034 TaxID=1481928 RepID=UPI0007867246|nr:hypothetical protein [Bacillus sp. JCM 19034]